MSWEETLWFIYQSSVPHFTECLAMSRKSAEHIPFSSMIVFSPFDSDFLKIFVKKLGEESCKSISMLSILEWLEDR